MNDKNRNWTFVLYPESAPDNWFSYLQDTGLPFAVSPLHDKDNDPIGDLKKAHYHIIICFPGPTTFHKVNTDICEKLNCPIPKRLLSIVGMFRYFTHKDNPDKYQYNENDIRCSNGFDIRDYNAITTSQTILLMKEIQLLIKKRKIYEYAVLMDYLLESDTTDLYLIASSHTLFFDRYLSSRRNGLKDFRNELFDKMNKKF